MSKQQVFIVDDDPIAIMILKKLIAKSNFHSAPLSFENGKLALDYFQNSYSSEDQYIVFLDINMPVMNGWEFLKAIETFAASDNTVVYLVTSSTDEADRNQAQLYPLVAEFLSKPISLSVLSELKAALVY